MRTLTGNRFIIALLCAAFIFKAMVPVGFMPDMAAAAQGVFKITICSSEGAKQIIVDHDMKLIDKGDGSAQQKVRHDFCPYGAAPHVALIAALVVFGLVAFAVMRRIFIDEDLLTVQHFSTIWARGPPLLS